MRTLAPISLGLILALAAVLRLWSIGHDLPYLQHPDEPGKLIIANRMLQTGDVNPHYFNKPTLQIYLNLAGQWVYYGIGRATGRFTQRGDVASPVELNTGVAYAPDTAIVLIGRGETVAFALASVLLLYLLTRRVTGSAGAGLLAAAMLAVSPTHVQLSRVVHQDVPMVCFVLLAAWASLSVLQRGAMRDYLIAGLWCGLASGTKYNGAFALLLPVAAHYLQRPAIGGDARLAAMLGVFGVSFLVTTPFALIDHNRFVADLLFESLHYAVGHPGMEGNAPLWYARYAVLYEGPVMLVAAVATVVALRRGRRDLILLAVMPVVYLAVIAVMAVRNEQTLLPVLPFAMLLAAWVLREAWLRLATTPHAALARFIAPWVVIAMLALPLARTCTAAHRLGEPDGRDTARAWIAANLPAGSTVALEAYGPWIDPQRHRIVPVLWLCKYDVQHYRDAQSDYAIAASGAYQRFYDDPTRYPREVKQYNALFAQWELVKTFTDGGYEIRIYRTRPAAASSTRDSPATSPATSTAP